MPQLPYLGVIIAVTCTELTIVCNGPTAIIIITLEDVVSSEDIVQISYSTQVCAELKTFLGQL